MVEWGRRQCEQTRLRGKKAEIAKNNRTKINQSRHAYCVNFRGAYVRRVFIRDKHADRGAGGEVQKKKLVSERGECQTRQGPRLNVSGPQVHSISCFSVVYTLQRIVKPLAEGRMTDVRGV